MVQVPLFRNVPNRLWSVANVTSWEHCCETGFRIEINWLHSQLARYKTLKMRSASSSETSATSYQTARGHIPEHNTFHNQIYVLYAISTTGMRKVVASTLTVHNCQCRHAQLRETDHTCWHLPNFLIYVLEVWQARLVESMSELSDNNSSHARRTQINSTYVSRYWNTLYTGLRYMNKDPSTRSTIIVTQFC